MPKYKIIFDLTLSGGNKRIFAEVHHVENYRPSDNYPILKFGTRPEEGRGSKS
ncbi:MAG: hypothetical protein J7K30_04050 [Deltaproteobacteria bacterium]|nr:hypothetical protein [Deltaproteobacteria bacterium]